MAAGIGVAGMGVWLLAPWWRNHALLLDFCDYGLVMAAVGRMGAGERPYLDFVTPIQTLQFVVSAGAEKVWGARYLSLTYANAVFVAGSFAALAAVLWRRLGAVAAIVVAAAVVAGSAGQHTIVWYNAVGTVVLAAVVWLLAGTREGRWSARVLAGVWVALWLGGMTKLTYQVAALAFAGAMTLRAGRVGEVTWRRARWALYGHVVFGVIAPVATELAWTGATPEQWVYNVIALPVEFRVNMLGQLASAGFYFHTPHDYYKPLHFTYAGAWGVGLLAVVSGIAAWRIWKMETRRAARGTMLAVLGGGAWICTGVILATNMDIAYLAGAAALVLATGIALAEAEGGAVGRGLRAVLVVAAVTLLVPGWLAAWRGTRALWGHEPLGRERMRAADELPAEFGYLRGLRITPSMFAALTEFWVKKETWAERGIGDGKYYFTNATEWMVRVMPEARHPGLPLWLAGGTTYSEKDAWVLANRIRGGDEIAVVVAHDAWNHWLPDVQAALKDGFRAFQLKERIFCYVWRDKPEPLEVAINTQSNLYFRGARVTGVTPEVRLGPRNLFYLGGGDPHRIDWEGPLYRLSGEAVGEVPAGAEALRPVFRVYAKNGDALADVLWEEAVELAPGAGPVTRTFAVSPGGREVSLVLHMPDGVAGDVGWRRLETQHAGAVGENAPRAVNRWLERRDLGASESGALFGDGEKPAALVAYGDVRVGDGELASAAPGEIWFRVDRGIGGIAGEYEWRGPAEVEAENVVRVGVIYYKSGRFEVGERAELRPGVEAGDRAVRRFEVRAPEGVGWFGLVVTTPWENRGSAGSVVWRGLRIR